jgi:hypothetical protein
MDTTTIFLRVRFKLNLTYRFLFGAGGSSELETPLPPTNSPLNLAESWGYHMSLHNAEMDRRLRRNLGTPPRWSRVVRSLGIPGRNK